LPLNTFYLKGQSWGTHSHGSGSGGGEGMGDGSDDSR